MSARASFEGEFRGCETGQRSHVCSTRLVKLTKESRVSNDGVIVPVRSVRAAPARRPVVPRPLASRARSRRGPGVAMASPRAARAAATARPGARLVHPGRADASRRASLSRRDDDVSEEARSDVSSARTAREPMRREAWSANGVNDEDLDEWDYAEKARPSREAQTRPDDEFAREKPPWACTWMTPSWARVLGCRAGALEGSTADPDFSGPESYPRRQRDWVGYYVAFVLCFASFVIGVAAISNRKARVPVPPRRIRERPSVRADAGMQTGRSCGTRTRASATTGWVRSSPCVSRRVRPRTTGYASTPTSRMLSTEARPPRLAATGVVYKRFRARVDGASPSPPPMPPSSACPSGVYLHSLMDFEPVFHACLPKDKENGRCAAPQRPGEAGAPEGMKAGEAQRRRPGGGSRELRRLGPRLRGSTSPPRDSHFESALRGDGHARAFHRRRGVRGGGREPGGRRVDAGARYRPHLRVKRDSEHDARKITASSLSRAPYYSARCQLFGLSRFLRWTHDRGGCSSTISGRPIGAARFVRAATPYLAVPARSRRSRHHRRANHRCRLGSRARRFWMSRGPCCPSPA